MIEHSLDKSDKNFASFVDYSKPGGRSELESESDESVSSATTCFSCVCEVDVLDVEARAFVVLSFLVSCWLGSVLLLLSPVFCHGL